MKKIVVFSLIFILLTALCSEDCSACGMKNTVYADGGYIKWIDFNVTYRALCDALKVDIETHGSSNHVGWVEILAYLASRNGGNFSSYKSSDTKKLLEKISDGSSVASHVTNEKLYKYYLEAYGAILGDMVGEYTEVRVAPDGSETGRRIRPSRLLPDCRRLLLRRVRRFRQRPLLRIQAAASRHDLMGSVGTLSSRSSGYVEAALEPLRGWRIGIRSFDGRRYYYYAHLRKNHPYNDIYEGKIVNAGEVIGYLGMTGYSSKENTNNIRTPHLHWGLQIIFDSSQKEGWNQIWIDLYALTRFLTANRAPVYKKDGEYYSKVYFEYPETPD